MEKKKSNSAYDPLQADPALRVVLHYDPTEPLASDEWPAATLESGLKKGEAAGGLIADFLRIMPELDERSFQRRKRKHRRVDL